MLQPKGPGNGQGPGRNEKVKNREARRRSRGRRCIVYLWVASPEILKMSRVKEGRRRNVSLRGAVNSVCLAKCGVYQ